MAMRKMVLAALLPVMTVPIAANAASVSRPQAVSYAAPVLTTNARAGAALGSQSNFGHDTFGTFLTGAVLVGGGVALYFILRHHKHDGGSTNGGSGNNPSSAT